MNSRVLVVDDYEPWRRRVAAELVKSGRWRVVGEAADGVEALRAANALQPDIIILDVGLPALNGVDAARRILGDDPGARILFLTAQSSPDIAEAALATGARGYLLKAEAGGKLMLAVEAIAAGAWFISPGLPTALVERTRERTRPGHSHDAVFHADDASLVNDYARFAEAALANGQPVAIVAAAGRLERVRERLHERGVAIDAAIQDGRYVGVDVAPELPKVFAGGRLDEERCRASAAALIETMARRAPGTRRVAIAGEIAPSFWRDGRTDAVLCVERAWDGIARDMGVDLLCGYVIDPSRVAEGDYSVFRGICAEHGTVHVR